MIVNDSIQCCSLIGGICNYMNDKHKTILEGTTGFFNMLGYTPKEFEMLFHCHAAEIIEPADLNYIEAQTKKSDMNMAEFRILHKDGTRHWILARFEIIGKEKGVYILQGIFNDITEIKQKQLDQEFVYQNIPCGVAKLKWNGVGRLLEANNKFYSMFGTSPVDYEASAFDRFSKADRERFRRYCALKVAAGENVDLEFKTNNKITGRPIWVRMDARLVEEKDGCKIYLGIAIDITKQKELQEQLESTKRLYESATDSSEDIVFDYDVINDVMKLFKPEPIGGILKSKIYEYDRYLRRMNTQKFIHPDDFEQVYHNCENNVAYPFEARLRRVNQKPGEYAWNRITLSSQYDDNHNITHLVGIMRDIDAAVKERKLLIDRASIDPLTGINNRISATEQITAYLNEVSGKKSYAMLVMDLDNFKPVNDTYGHMFGDSVLIQFAKNLTKIIGKDDIAGRLGGDEFIVFLKKGMPEHVRDIAAEICRMTREIYVGDVGNMSCSIGAAISCKKDVEVDLLFKTADNALYMQKGAGKDGLYIADELLADMDEKLKMTYVSDRNTTSGESNVERHFSDVVFNLLDRAQDKQKAVPMTMIMLGDKYRWSRISICLEKDGILEVCQRYVELSHEKEFINTDMNRYYSLLKNSIRDIDYETYEGAEVEQFRYIEKRKCNVKFAYASLLYHNGKPAGLLCMEDCENEHALTERECASYKIYGMLLAAYLMK